MILYEYWGLRKHYQFPCKLKAHAKATYHTFWKQKRTDYLAKILCIVYTLRVDYNTIPVYFCNFKGEVSNCRESKRSNKSY